MSLSVQAGNRMDGTDNKGAKATVEAATSESWEFYSSTATPTTEELAAADNHKLGQEVACLYGAFMDIYVVKEEVVPGDPVRRTVIRKPGIYNAVRSIEKQLMKSVKQNTLTKEQAANELTNVLTIALAAIDSDSDSFEKALQRDKKDSERLLALFGSVKLKKL